jgi:hypothetical protein
MEMGNLAAILGCATVAALILIVSSPYAWAAQKYALRECQTYNGPNKESGKFFFKPTAQKALTLDKNRPYSVLKEEGNWLQVDVFGKTPCREINGSAIDGLLPNNS